MECCRFAFALAIAAFAVAQDFQFKCDQVGDFPIRQGACEPIFFKCAAGRHDGILTPCPEGTVFDVDSISCQFKQFVRACGGEATQKPPVVVAAPTTPPFAFDCSRRTETNFGNPNKPCSNLFVTCANGEAIFRQCPGATKFDHITKECLSEEFVKTCHGTPTERPPPVVADPPAFTYECISVGTFEDPRSEKKTKYGTCSELWISCAEVGSRADVLTCPASLFYDAELDECARKEEVPACGGRRPELTTRVQIKPVAPIFVAQCVGEAPIVDPRANVRTANGVCSQYWGACAESGATATVMQCPDMTFFDAEFEMCSFAEVIPACGGIRPLPVNKTTEHPIVPAPEGFCNGKQFGNYAFDATACTDKYISCSPSIHMLERCVGEEVAWDAENNRCEFKAALPVCGGTRPVQADEPIAQPPPVDPSLLAFCAGKASGNYATGQACSASYIACVVGGRPSLNKCPAYTKYSAAEDACMAPSDVVDCEQEEEQQALETQSCEGRTMGFYPVVGDCSKFVFCDKSHAIELECAGSLVFDAKHMRCRDPAEVVDSASCGRMPPPESFKCEGRTLGRFYADVNSCKDYFFCELDGSLWTFECEPGFAFDAEKEECMPEAHVKNCLPPRDEAMRPFCQEVARDGIFASPYVCTEGVICLQSYAFRVECAQNLMFNRVVLSCTAVSTAEAACQE